MDEPPIRDVSDTAFWIAHHRALESRRPDALFRDPLAEHLAGDSGAKIAAAMPNAALIGWSVAIRTHIIDSYIGWALSNGVDTVLNLGAGLDTRPYRMALPASLHWIEADFARIIEYKEALLQQEHPRCHTQRIKIDLADRTLRQNLFARVNAEADSVLVLTEGVVPYSSEEAAGLLADDLRANAHMRYWLVDYFSPQAIKYRMRSGMTRTMQNAPFRFAPEDWSGFFRQHGWRASQMRYLAEEGMQLGRPMPLPWLAKALVKIWSPFLTRERLAAMRNFAGYGLLEPC